MPSKHLGCIRLSGAGVGVLPIRLKPFRCVVGEDTYIPLGPAANLVLPSVEQIVEAAGALAGAPAEKENASRPAGGRRRDAVRG